MEILFPSVAVVTIQYQYHIRIPIRILHSTRNGVGVENLRYLYENSKKKEEIKNNQQL